MGIVYRVKDINTKEITAVGIAWERSKSLANQLNNKVFKSEADMKNYSVEYINKDIESKLEADLLFRHYAEKFCSDEWNQNNCPQARLSSYVHDAKDNWKIYYYPNRNYAYEASEINLIRNSYRLDYIEIKYPDGFVVFVPIKDMPIETSDDIWYVDMIDFLNHLWRISNSRKKTLDEYLKTLKSKTYRYFSRDEKKLFIEYIRIIEDEKSFVFLNIKSKKRGENIGMSYWLDTIYNHQKERDEKIENLIEYLLSNNIRLYDESGKIINR